MWKAVSKMLGSLSSSGPIESEGSLDAAKSMCIETPTSRKKNGRAQLANCGP